MTLCEVNEKSAILLKLLILDDGETDWFTERHKQEMLLLILDAVQQRLKTVYELQTQASKNKKENSEQKKTDGEGIQEGIIRGDTLKIGYKFSKHSSNLHCVLPNESISLSPASDEAPYSGGGYNPITFFPEKLDLYICEYKPDRGQQTELTSTMSLTGRNSPKISDYFKSASSQGINRFKVNQTESAVKKKMKLKSIVQKGSKSDSTSIPKPTGGVGGGFLSGDDAYQRCQTDTTKSSQLDTKRFQYSESEEEEEQEDGNKGPIYIDSDASSEDSVCSHIFDNVMDKQQNVQVKQSVVKNNRGFTENNSGFAENNRGFAESSVANTDAIGDNKLDAVLNAAYQQCADSLDDVGNNRNADVSDSAFHSNAQTKRLADDRSNRKEDVTNSKYSSNTKTNRLVDGRNNRKDVTDSGHTSKAKTKRLGDIGNNRKEDVTDSGYPSNTKTKSFVDSRSNRTEDITDSGHNSSAETKRAEDNGSNRKEDITDNRDSSNTKTKRLVDGRNSRKEDTDSIRYHFNIKTKRLVDDTDNRKEDMTDSGYHSKAKTKRLIKNDIHQKERCYGDSGTVAGFDKDDVAAEKTNSKDDNILTKSQGDQNIVDSDSELCNRIDDDEIQNDDFGDFWSLGQDVDTQREDTPDDATNDSSDNDAETKKKKKKKVTDVQKPVKEYTAMAPYKRVPTKKNKVQSKLKLNKPTSAISGRKRPLCNMDDSDDDSPNNLATKSKKLLTDSGSGGHYEHFSSSSRGKQKESLQNARQEKDKSKGQRSSQENKGRRLHQSKENTKPAECRMPSTADVVDLCSDDDDDDDDDLGPSDSLIDVIGDKRDIRRLNDGDIEYLMKRNKHYFKKIFSGKIACRRHQDYKAGGYLRSDLNHSVRFGPFTDEQQDMIIRALIRVFCRKHNHYFDYVTKVLLPEALAKICMEIQGVTHPEAEKFLRETPSSSFCA
ncbi:uncharacterized protein [Amphiura filiformis]|uniref:uncharacterized protein isoform X2 n=1 Tax=Amphiura filiformis TaxID=82378 RepID=UPI003B21E675